MDKRHELIRQFSEYAQLSEEEKTQYWAQCAEEAQKQSQEEKGAYQDAIKANVEEIRQKILSIKQQVEEVASSKPKS